MGKGLSPLLCPSPRGGGREGTARLADLLWVQTLNTRFEAAGWQLVRVVGLWEGSQDRRWSPALPPQPCSASVGRVWPAPSRGLQQQERQKQHGPGKWEEAGGSAVPDAVQDLDLWVICKVRGQTPPR